MTHYSISEAFSLCEETNKIKIEKSVRYPILLPLCGRSSDDQIASTILNFINCINFGFHGCWGFGSVHWEGGLCRRITKGSWIRPHNCACASSRKAIYFVSIEVTRSVQAFRVDFLPDNIVSSNVVKHAT
jgi:hypothetical protein